MNLHIERKTKIYVVAPAFAATGGPELLHQLVFNLRQTSLDAYMYYIPSRMKEPVHPAYKIYNNPFVRVVDDKYHNILIVPETCKTVELLHQYKKIQRVIWWLSVDNFYQSMFETRCLKGLWMQAVNKIFKLTRHVTKYDLAEESLKFFQAYELKKDKNVQLAMLHLVQSSYARNHLLNKGISPEQIAYLSDYLNDHFFDDHKKFKKFIRSKRNIVLYNPKKGYKFTKALMSNAPHIKFIPIQKMAREDVVAIMKKAKIYIDFGNHPGKDRMTREAAVLGCIIITSKRGSAGDPEDVPIADKYKFEDDHKNIPKIVAVINDCLENYEKFIDDFSVYRKKISLEKEVFHNDLKKVFQELSLKSRVKG